MVAVGHGLYGKVRFVDGTMPEYSRTYLVVCVEQDRIGLLNVSSSKGKEHKLLFDTNNKIEKYQPPFLMPSFVKLDSLTFISHRDASSLRLLHNGDKLDREEIQQITAAIDLSREVITDSKH